jgi:hypothetical protein
MQPYPRTLYVYHSLATLSTNPLCVPLTCNHVQEPFICTLLMHLSNTHFSYTSPMQSFPQTPYQYSSKALVHWHPSNTPFTWHPIHAPIPTQSLHAPVSCTLYMHHSQALFACVPTALSFRKHVFTLPFYATL